MSRWMYALTLSLSLLAFTSPARAADDPAAIVTRAKAATVVVLLPNDHVASAVCIDPTGVFLTSRRALGRINAGAKLTVIVNPGDAAPAKLPVTLSRLDETTGLAVLVADTASNLTALPLADTSTLVETSQLSEFGYPADGNSVRTGKFADVVVLVERITSIHKTADKITSINLDLPLAGLTPGGASVDADGKLAGIIDNVDEPSIIPANLIPPMMAKPLVAMIAPAVTYAHRHDPVQFKARIVTTAPSAATAVQLVLGSPDNKQTIPGVLQPDSTYTFDVPALLPATRPAHVAVNAIFADGNVRAAVDDVDFKVGDKSYKLSQNVQINRKTPDGDVTLRIPNAAPVTGALTIPPLTLYVGGSSTTLDVSKIESLSSNYNDVEPRHVPYLVEVKVNDVLVNSVQGGLDISPDPATQSSTQPTTAPDTKP